MWCGVRRLLVWGRRSSGAAAGSVVVSSVCLAWRSVGVRVCVLLGYLCGCLAAKLAEAGQGWDGRRGSDVQGAQCFVATASLATTDMKPRLHLRGRARFGCGCRAGIGAFCLAAMIWRRNRLA